MNRVRRHRRAIRQAILDWVRPVGPCPRCAEAPGDCECCPWCPGYGPGDQGDHAMDCPITTGVFPVDDTLVAMDTCCVDCGQRFVEGDSYGYAQDRHDPNTFDVVCLGCIARSELGLNLG